MKPTTPITYQPYLGVQPYVTKDRSTIRELMCPTRHGNQAQSLAEAIIPAGGRTLLHRHLRSEEIYYIVRGDGMMTLDGKAFFVKAGDTICIPPGTPHAITAGPRQRLRILCACSPAYSHDDTELLEPEPVVVSAPAPEPGPSAPASSFEALVGARDAAGSNPLDSLAAPALSPQDALAAAIAGNAYAAPTEMPAGAVHADEIERTYGPLTCKALPALMEWLALRSDLDSLAGETHAITMMTIHSAKGLEFPAVFVAGMEEGIFPHVHDFGGSDDPGKLEEERRLAYVAITRARKRLFLTYAATRRTYGSTSANPRSRFLNEIPFEDIEFSGIGSAGFEGTGWEKRGDRHGTFGSGMGSDMYGGKVFGSHTRSTGGSGSRGGSSFDDFFGGSSYGTERHRGVSPDAGRVASTFGSGAPRAKKPSSKVSPTVERKVDRASASQDFAAGDTVSHKTFGTGTVISVAGDMIEVQFEKTGQTKKLMKGFAPIVKLNA